MCILDKEARQATLRFWNDSGDDQNQVACMQHTRDGTHAQMNMLNGIV